ncbi:hypothetical protein ACWGKU_20430 [Kitasatospora sp. NPDC054768]
MSDPDNVARVIAGGSALAAAFNLAVSHATYRRKRPSLWFKVKVEPTFTNRYGVLEDVGVRFLVTLHNRGEAPLRIEGAEWQVRFDERPRTLKLLLFRRLPWYFHKRTDLRPVEGDFPIELAGFERREVTADYPSCHGDWSGPEEMKGRLTIRLPGGVKLSDRWRKPFFFACTCEECQPPAGVQLSFDDLED